MRAGSMKSVEMAVMAGQSITTIPTKSATKAGTVLAAVEVRRKAKRNSFHENRKTTMETVIMAGFLMGGMIFFRGCNPIAPSIIAPPSSSMGTPPKEPLRNPIERGRLKGRENVVRAKKEKYNR